MIIARLLRQAAIAAGASWRWRASRPQPASAQLFWDWGGGSIVGGSGREVVRFSPQYRQGPDHRQLRRPPALLSSPSRVRRISYPIAVPREQSRWQGVTSVSRRSAINPSWTPTPTMIAENPRLPRWVPGGHPMNPLGVRALYLGSSTYRIHGTDAPWTIGTAVSKGCIRMYNQDVLDLYPRVDVGTKVTVTYQSFAGVASSSPSPSFGSSSSGNGSIFDDLFGSSSPAPEKPRRKVTRAKSAANTNKASTPRPQ